MAEQKTPTSHIPRLSKLPVRTSIASVQRPEQLTGGPKITTDALGSLKVSRSRPMTKQSSLYRQPSQQTDCFVKPSIQSTPARKGPAVAKIAPVDDVDDGHKEETDEHTARTEIARPKTRKPRPSLSDRAIQTLSQIPPSPSPRRRQSGFFPTDSPAKRPPSSLGRNRLVTSAGFYPPLPTSRPSSPSKRPGTSRRTNQSEASTPSRPTLQARAAPRAVPRKPQDSARDNTTAVVHDDTIQGTTQPLSTAANSKPSLKSSAALRETIANAKAARRAVPKYAADEIVKPVNQCIDLPAPRDEDDIHVNLLRKRINAARKDGRLNISGMGLKVFPHEVLRMYEPDNMTDGPAWYESVDLVRLDASNNEIEDLGRDFLDDPTEQRGDQPLENIFVGLQILNLQGNRLRSLPSSLQDFEHLTVLNLSRNCLGQSNDMLGIISNMSSLREVHLAENHCSGPLPPFAGCSNLEVLDLHSNSFASLPEEMSEYRSLRRLDVSANKITKFPRLDLPNLTSLNVSSNQIDVDNLITNLVAPTLVDLDISMCRINGLPDMRSKLPSLRMLIAYDNQISTLEVESLRGLEVLDLRNNDLRSLPAELSLLGLKKLMVGGNPMRAPRRDILEGTTERLMEWLRSRLPASILDERCTLVA